MLVLGTLLYISLNLVVLSREELKAFSAKVTSLGVTIHIPQPAFMSSIITRAISCFG